MVTFETKVWENDWKYILTGNYLDRLIDRCHFPFEEKTLIINNVSNRGLVQKYAENKVRKGIIDHYYFAEDYADETLAFFNLTKDSFKGGYYYSIGELVSIYLCKTDYLLHFSSDTFLPKDKIAWIEEALKVFKSRKDIIVANPSWNYSFKSAKKESMDENDLFYIGYGFSDQCYLIKTDIFRQRIYNETNDFSERYPKYGGQLFEKRVDSFMRNNHLLRISSKKKTYIHRNFPKNSFYYNCCFLDKVYAWYRLLRYGFRLAWIRY